ncbi:hypothetical protein [Paenibacillus cremeus]|uniref:Uncharacterized protein n=1 Tax=Paenibacillus cremeus TaxID=2163881 RepID=A0A559K5D3_9BACL|nr:hypothetical protein [Paenibacillus cremeus]TVY07349.1 hypothetical protein FPZ49_24205 [Paenibacillus cremeus]
MMNINMDMLDNEDNSLKKKLIGSSLPGRPNRLEKFFSSEKPAAKKSEESKVKVTAVSLSTALFEHLEEYCKKTNLKRSTVLSMALEAYLNRQI